MKRSGTKSPEFEDVLGERRSTIVTEETRDLRGLLLLCNITCGSGLEHDAEVCIVCPRFVSCTPAVDRRSVTIECWWHRSIERSPEPAIAPPRRMARGSNIIAVPTLDERCASCHDEDDLIEHVTMIGVYFCRSCTEQISEPIHWSELGTGG